MVKIYESPDGGQTVYERDTVTGKRVCIEKPTFPDWYIDDHDWYEICELANQGNRTLQKMLKEIKLIHDLSKDPEETYDD